MKHRFILAALFLLLFSTAIIYAKNPFEISFAPKQHLTDDDYLNIQKQLREINLVPLLNEHYIPNAGYQPYEEFLRRWTIGANQIFIDPERGLYPIKKLEKIGNGGDNCIVTYITYNKTRSTVQLFTDLIKSIPEALKASGFNGYFYYRIGGFPNPPGFNLKYIGVPYSFKIPMMLEAKELGFNKVMWIDSSILPLRDLSPIFDRIEKEGAYMVTYINEPLHATCILPHTRQLLKDLTGVDVIKGKHRATAVIGLKMNSEKTNNLIKEYDKFVEMGTPFLSTFPEEFVFNAIMSKEGNEWPSENIFQVLKYPLKGSEDDNEMKKIKDEGYYFYLRRH